MIDITITTIMAFVTSIGHSLTMRRHTQFVTLGAEAPLGFIVTLWVNRESIQATFNYKGYTWVPNFMLVSQCRMIRNAGVPMSHEKKCLCPNVA